MTRRMLVGAAGALVVAFIVNWAACVLWFTLFSRAPGQLLGFAPWEPWLLHPTAGWPGTMASKAMPAGIFVWLLVAFFAPHRRSAWSMAGAGVALLLLLVVGNLGPESSPPAPWWGGLHFGLWHGSKLVVALAGGFLLHRAALAAYDRRFGGVS